MRLPGTKTEKVDVDVPDREILKAAARMLRQRAKLPHDSYLENGKITTYYGRNNLTEYHGDPTPEQLEALNACKLLETGL